MKSSFVRYIACCFVSLFPLRSTVTTEAETESPFMVSLYFINPVRDVRASSVAKKAASSAGPEKMADSESVQVH